MTKKSTIPEKLKPFIFHGVDINQHPKQAQGDCPFCGKATHFYVKTPTGQWSCKVCEEEGNILSFLSKLHQYSEEALQDSPSDADTMFEGLADDRGIPAKTFLEWGIVPSFINNEWLVPTYNAKGKLANLYKAIQDREGKWKVMSSPGCKLHPFGVQFIIKAKKADTVWVVEGLWDALKAHSVLGSIRKNGDRFVQTTDAGQSLLPKEVVMGIPGAKTFNADWLQYLEDKKVRLLFDNDYPKKTPSGKVVKHGWDGMKRVIDIAGENGRLPRSIFRIRWGKAGYDKKRKDGYDFRDLLIEEGPTKGIKTALGLMERVKVEAKATEDQQPDLEPIERTAFKDVIKDYSQALHFTPQLQDTLAVMLACVASTQLGGDQIWLRIIGPPGSGKSTLAEAISATKEHIFPVSTITGLHSGFVGGGRGKKTDAALIPFMNNKTVIIKDGDTLLTAPGRDRILAEMRDLYDGTSRNHYRNRQAKSYENIKTTFIICGTDEMRSLNRSFLGERFLDCEIMGDADQTPYLDRALDNAFESVTSSLADPDDPDNEQNQNFQDRMTFLKRVTMGFIEYFKDNMTKIVPPTMDPPTGTRIKALGRFLSFVRARVNREGNDLAYRPRAELATRLVGQFAKLGVCLAIVLGKPKVDRDVVRIIKKVMLDTGESFQLDIIKLLARYKTGGLSCLQIGMEIRISEGNARKLMNDMLEFNIVERLSRNNRSGQRGRNLHLWKLTDEMKALYKLAIKGKV